MERRNHRLGAAVEDVDAILGVRCYAHGLPHGHALGQAVPVIGRFIDEASRADNPGLRSTYGHPSSLFLFLFSVVAVTRCDLILLSKPQGQQDQDEERADIHVRIWYCNTMYSTIDKAGRVVIPAAMRAKAGLRPGTKLEVLLEDFSIRLVRAVPGPKIVKRGRRLVARPTVPRDQVTSVDIATLVEEERNRWPW